MTTHMSLDIEALGGDYIGPILSIGVCVFDHSGVYDPQEWILDWANEPGLGSGVHSIDLGTVKWWFEQVSEGNSTPFAEGAISTDEAFSQFVDYVDRHKPELLWAKDPDYDCEHMKYYMDQGCVYVWPFRPWAQRSVRTVFDLAVKKDPTFKTRPTEGTAHTAMSDAMFQARRIIEAHKILEVRL